MTEVAYRLTDLQRHGPQWCARGELTDGQTFSASRPRLLAAGNFLGGLTGVSVAGSTFADYDVAPDGRFVMFPNSGDEAPNIQPARVVVNWFQELHRLVPRR